MEENIFIFDNIFIEILDYIIISDNILTSNQLAIIQLNEYPDGRRYIRQLAMNSLMSVQISS